MTQQNNILNGVEIVRDGDQILAMSTLRLTEAKLEVLVEVAKAFEQTLPELIGESIARDIRALLEGSSEALDKILCDTWLKEIGEAPEGDDKK